MKKKKINPRWVRIETTAGTVALRNPKNGRLKGRRRVKGKGDTTKTRRLRRNIDLNKDGIYEYEKGEIVGRTKRKKVKVRATKRTKGYMRKI